MAMLVKEAPAPDDGAEARGRATVLVVDDYPIDRRIAGAAVEAVPGLRAAFAEDGAGALAELSRARPALVLTDLQMPGMDGLELVRAVRRDFPEVPVVLMTAHGSEEVAIEALRAGAASYVPKRSLGRDLAPTLRQVLQAAAAGGRRRRVLGCLEERSCVLRLENDPGLIGTLVELFREDLDGLGLFDEATRIRVTVAFQEALANAVYHGNLEVSSDLRQDDERIFRDEAERRRGLEPYRSRVVRVEARLGRGGATLAIEDQGPGFDTARLDRPIEPEELLRVGGRGLLLIRAFMDEVTFNASGNRIVMVKRGASRD